LKSAGHPTKPIQTLQNVCRIIIVHNIILETMDKESDPCCCWAPESILVPAGDGRDPIDIAPYLRNDDHPLGALMRNRTRLEFPIDVYPPTWEEREKIQSAIIKSAAEQQIFLVKACATNSNKTPVLVLKCDLGRSYQVRKGANEFQKNPYGDRTNVEEPKYRDGIRKDNIVRKSDAVRANGKKKAKRTTTLKPPPHQTCPFGIRVSLQQGVCWYIPPWSGNIQHKFHPKPLPGEIRRRINTLDTEQQEAAARYLRYTGSGAASNIMYEETNESFSRSQLHYNKKKIEILTGHVPPPLQTKPGEPPSTLSTAEELIAYLEKEQGLQKKSYIALFHKATETNLLTIKKSDQKRDNIRRKSFMVHQESSIVGGNVKVTAPVLFSEEEQLQLESSLCPIRERLKVGQKILLAIVWVREDERRLFELFPEVLMCDVTFQTNGEGRPLFVTAAFDAYMKTFTPVRAFLPSECQWVFHWLWRTAIPALLGKDNIARTQFVLTDGDPKMYIPFDSIKEDLYPAAIYHLVIQGMQKLKILFRDDTAVDGMLNT
jgi:hypothetical protein